MFESIRAILERSISKLRLEPHLSEGKLIASWEQMIDPDLAGSVFPERLERGVLHLRVISPAHMNEVKLRQKSLIQKINKAMGENLVSDLRLRIDAPPPG